MVKMKQSRPVIEVEKSTGLMEKWSGKRRTHKDWVDEECNRFQSNTEKTIRGANNRSSRASVERKRENI